jgi:hypothetical protein
VPGWLSALADPAWTPTAPLHAVRACRCYVHAPPLVLRACLGPPQVLPCLHGPLAVPLLLPGATCRVFTDTALALSLTLLNSAIDLISFSGILYSIYPPLFAALLAYSIGGTAASIALGRVGLWHMITQG